MREIRRPNYLTLILVSLSLFLTYSLAQAQGTITPDDVDKCVGKQKTVCTKVASASLLKAILEYAKAPTGP